MSFTINVTTLTLLHKAVYFLQSLDIAISYQLFFHAWLCSGKNKVWLVCIISVIFIILCNSPLQIQFLIYTLFDLIAYISNDVIFLLSAFFTHHILHPYCVMVFTIALQLLHSHLIIASCHYIHFSIVATRYPQVS